MKRYLYVYPIVAAILVGVVGWWALHTVRAEVRKKLDQELQTLLAADVTSLEVWMESQMRTANVIAGGPQLRGFVAAISAEASEAADPVLALQRSETVAQLRQHLLEAGERAQFVGFTVIDRNNIVLAAPFDPLVGRQLRGGRMSNLMRLFETEEPQLVIPLRGPPQVRRLGGPGGEGPAPGVFPRGNPTNGSRPFVPPPSESGTQGVGGGGPPGPGGGARRLRDLLGADSEWQRQLMVMVSSPVRNEEGEVVAALGLQIRPEGDFTRLLSSARFGLSGETYAFNKDAVMISQSRFEADLQAVGLLPRDSEEGASVLNLDLRDPGGPLFDGFQPGLDRSELPLIRAVESALAGNSGVDVNGFRDYRGVRVVGAWRWLPEYEIGVVTSVDYDEAYQPLLALRRIFLVLMGLLVFSTVGLFIYSLRGARLQARVKEAELRARELGQYRLEDKIGEGGMGVVYLARHALLRRPTAVKLLLPNRASAEGVAQFEQEVQLTSQLSHPNTIQIYDYGRTADGIFYYVMEYLEGVSLRQLVRRDGALPPGRVLMIMRQICGSLGEAHLNGLVHRDIKPANIFLTRRAGRHDWVKVLDFGLVRPNPRPQAVGPETPGRPVTSVVGTPGYMAPEAFTNPEQVDERSDLYALAAVTLYLLTGREVFEGMKLEEIERLHRARAAQERLEPLLASLGPVVRGFLSRCLDADPERRPQSVEEFAEGLSGCLDNARWTEDDARAWWQDFEVHRGTVADDSTVSSALSTIRIDLKSRVSVADRPRPGKVQFLGNKEI